MNISIWDIFHYIFKWKFMIAAALIVCYGLTVFYVNFSQTYTAQVVLEFKDDCISQGNSPDGEKFDRYEIASPDILTNVIDELSLNCSVEDLRSGLTVTPIIPESEKAIQESKQDNGEKYEYYSNIFSITYSGKRGQSGGETSDILEALVHNYMDFYNENYVNLASINDATFDEEIGDYDYLELAEVISDRIDETISRLNNYYNADGKFRAPSTGMTFQDIQKEYTHLRDYVMPELFSDIYRGQISKNKDLLIEKYIQRVENYNLNQSYRQSQADLTRDRMDNFAEANERVPNSYNDVTKQNNDGLEILDQVYDDYYYEEKRDTTTTYDALITDYVGHAVAANNNRLDADYCAQVITKFTAPLEEGVDVAELTANIEKNLSDTKTKMNELYKTLSQTIADYNETKIIRHLSPMTGVNYYNNLNMPFYLLIIMFAGLFLSVIAAITIEIYREYKAFRKEEEEEAPSAETAAVGSGE